MPLTQAAAAEVPPRNCQPSPPGTAPRTPSPGATTSGFGYAAAGLPVLDHSSTRGTARVTGRAARTTRPRGCLTAQETRRRPSPTARWTVGTACRSAERPPGSVLTSTMPTPSASATVWDLSTRPTPPRSQSTTRPATTAVSREPGSQRRASPREAPRAAASAPRTRRARRGSVGEVIAPTRRVPPPSRTSPRRTVTVPAPTVVTQGEECAVPPTASPPAAATTTTSASAAPRSASSTVSRVEGPATDRLSTSTPSATARSMAATRSAVEQPSSAGSGAVQQAL